MEDATAAATPAATAATTPAATDSATSSIACIEETVFSPPSTNAINGEPSFSHILWLQRETAKLLRMELTLVEREKNVAMRERNLKQRRWGD